MELIACKIPAVFLLEVRRFGDHRGFFAETYNEKHYKSLGLNDNFVQDNQSLSAEVGTVRGLHFQSPHHAQAKLIRCGRGAIFDVAVDIRRGSPTYGKWVGHELNAENGKQMFIPTGFAHGFMTLLPNSEIIYKCSDYYAPEMEGSLLWNDPMIAIDWPLKAASVLSEKDAAAPQLSNLNSPFEWDGEK